jgi:hypothetical protein
MSMKACLSYSKGLNSITRNYIQESFDSSFELSNHQTLPDGPLCGNSIYVRSMVQTRALVRPGARHALTESRASNNLLQTT